MHTQKTAILHMVQEARQNGRRVGEVLATLGIKRATYGRWKQGANRKAVSPRRTLALLPEEQRRIDEVKRPIPRIGIGGFRGYYRPRGATSPPLRCMGT
jgi:hypothetical protein